jgi:hypothetical protein
MRLPDLSIEASTRRNLARIVQRVMAKDRYPNRPTFPLLLYAALQDAGYWQMGGPFGFYSVPETGGVHLRTWDRPADNPPAESWRFYNPAQRARDRAAAGKFSRRDPALNERNRVDLGWLVTYAIKNDLPFLALLYEALEDGRYFQDGHRFAMVLDRETGLPVLYLAAHDYRPARPPGSVSAGQIVPVPVYQTCVSLRLDVNFDEMAWPELEGDHDGRGEGWALSL